MKTRSFSVILFVVIAVLILTGCAPGTTESARITPVPLPPTSIVEPTPTLFPTPAVEVETYAAFAFYNQPYRATVLEPDGITELHLFYEFQRVSDGMSGEAMLSTPNNFGPIGEDYSVYYTLEGQPAATLEILHVETILPEGVAISINSSVYLWQLAFVELSDGSIRIYPGTIHNLNWWWVEEKQSDQGGSFFVLVIEGSTLNDRFREGQVISLDGQSYQVRFGYDDRGELTILLNPSRGDQGNA